MNYKISIVGTRETILGFKALGLEPFYVSEPEAAVATLYDLKKERAETKGESHNKYAIIFIMEDLMSAVTDDDYKKLTADPLPAIIPLPSHLGSSGYGLKKLKTIVEKAVGMDILN
ncbi:V-type ATP synthase subunit F [Candidatus Peregrinibacteria bacterium]|nr:V-type ATP synthase subunit F [Candidatus Peregrinibacteria bacterium]